MFPLRLARLAHQLGIAVRILIVRDDMGEFWVGDGSGDIAAVLS